MGRTSILTNRSIDKSINNGNYTNRSIDKSINNGIYTNRSIDKSINNGNYTNRSLLSHRNNSNLSMTIPQNKYANKSIDEMNIDELNNAIDTPQTGMN